MNISEGQIYEGTVTIAGTPDDTLRRWIVVAPFGKTHIHSLGNPDGLHCWPISVIIGGLQQGTVKLVGEEPHHPILQLQRAKEAHDIVDTHLGLHGERLTKMLTLLRHAVDQNVPYAPQAAAEITALLDRTAHNAEQVAEIEQEVAALLKHWRGGAHPDTP